MPAPNRKSPAKVARLLELHKQGASAREIADDLGLGSHMTALAWLRASGLEPNGGHGTRKARHRAGPNGVVGKLADAQLKLAELAKGPAPRDLGEVLARLREDFALVSALVRFHVERAGQGQSTMAELEKAIRIQESFATKIRELTPQETNPDHDPANMQAAGEVRTRLALLVDAAEREFKCRHCGANPYG